MQEDPLAGSEAEADSADTPTEGEAPGAVPPVPEHPSPEPAAPENPALENPAPEHPAPENPAPGSPGAAESVPAPEEEADGLLILRWALPVCLLAWLVPGGGHLVLGRRARGVLFFLLIGGLFAGGLLLEGQVYRPVPGEPLSYLAAFGASGSGLLYMIVNFLGVGVGDVAARFHEYGNTFTLLAGLLNLLLVLDAYDCAVERALLTSRPEAAT